MRTQKVQRSLRGQFLHPSAQQQAATEPNQAANSSMLRGRSSGSRSPPAPIGRFRERSATTKYHRPANLHSAPSMAEVPRYFPVLPGNSSRCHGKPETEGRQVPQPAGGGSRIGLKMQAALEITARYCGRELEQYGQCVAAKPESWQRDCHHLKMSIAQCTSAHPVIRQIRQACSEPFEAFEECLRQNEAAVGNCAEHVRRFLQCAEQVQPTHRPSTLEAHPLPAS
ncbi:hypothetical protein AB1E18_008725 [Capra hircus]